MTMHEQMRQDLLKQKAQIESRGRLNGRDLELNLGTFLVGKGDKYYSNGNFSFETPDELDRRDATELAFKTGGIVFKSEVYWGKKHQTICQALSSL